MRAWAHENPGNEAARDEPADRVAAVERLVRSESWL
jgi:hypothetical protein